MYDVARERLRDELTEIVRANYPEESWDGVFDAIEARSGLVPTLGSAVWGFMQTMYDIGGRELTAREILYETE